MNYATLPVVRPKRFTIDDYHRLIELGFLTEDDGIELIRGELVQMAAKGTPHSACNSNLLYELLPALQGQALVRHQDPIVLASDSEPEPDFAIVQLRDDRYAKAHPRPEDVFLIIEVSDSTIAYDQTEKLAVYAENGIGHYWIVNLQACHLERYSQPYQERNGAFGYRLKEISLPDETVSVPGFESVVLELRRIFPAEG